jgi:hypothetical protein
LPWPKSIGSYTHSIRQPWQKRRKKIKSVQSSGQLEKYKHSSKAQSSTAQLGKERRKRKAERGNENKPHTHTHSSSTRWAAAMLRCIGDNILLLWRLLCFPIEWLCRWLVFLSSFFPSVCAVSIIIYRQCDRFILHANEWQKELIAGVYNRVRGEILMDGFHCWTQKIKRVETIA